MQLGYYLWNKDEKLQATEFILNALQLAEKENNKRVLTRVYHFTTFIYEDRRGVEYAFKARELSKQTGEGDWECYALMDLVNYYHRWEKCDSALIYANEAYEGNLHGNNGGKAREKPNC